MHSAPHGAPLGECHAAVHGAALSASHRAGGDRRVLSKVVRGGGHRLRMRCRQIPPLARRAHGSLLATRPICMCTTQALHSAICVHCIYTAYPLHIHCICTRTAYAQHMHSTCRRVWWASTSRVASSLSRARVVTPKGALHMHAMSVSMFHVRVHVHDHVHVQIVHVHSMVHCIAASMVHPIVHRCQGWVGGLVD